MGKGYEEVASTTAGGTDPSNPLREHSPKPRPQDVPTFEDANSVHLLGNMKEGGLNNPRSLRAFVSQLTRRRC